MLLQVGSVSVLGYLVVRDLQARDIQMARLMREDELGACQLELANGRVLRLAQLRWGLGRRVVAWAGSRAVGRLAGSWLVRHCCDCPTGRW